MITRFSEHPKQSFFFAAAIILFVTLLRILFLNASELDLFFDEAQYWFWSKHPDWGYYSKPPMVSWMVWLTTSVCGEGEACIRLSSPLLHAGTSIILYFLGKDLYSTRVGFYSSLTYLLIPAVTLSSGVVSTDPSLLFFWALSLLLFNKAIHKNNLLLWLLAGLSAGFGMISKYNMIIFLLSAMWFLASYKDYRHYLKSRNFWLAVIIAILVFVPNILWNASNGFASFLHTRDNASGNSQYFNFSELWEFFSAQFIVFGPILFASLLIAIFIITRQRKFFWKDRSTALLFTMVLPLFLLILIISFVTRAHANWAAPVYVPATVLVVHFMLGVWNKKSLLVISSIIHVLIASVFIYMALSSKPFGLTYAARTNINYNEIRDPFIRLRGWQELGSIVSKLHARVDKNSVLLTHSRKTFAEIMYYANPPFYNAVNWQPGEQPKDHFMLKTSNDDLIGMSAFYVAGGSPRSDILNSFSETEIVEEIYIKTAKGKSRKYIILYLKGYQG